MSSNSWSFLTITEALQRYSTSRLQELAELLGFSEYSDTKEILIDLIKFQLSSEKLATIWTELDRLQQAAIAEVVYSDKNYFIPEKFKAKYGENPEWNSSELQLNLESYRRKPSKLFLFFYIDRYDYNAVMPDDIKATLKAFVPPPIPMEIKTLEEIPKAFQRQIKDGSIRTRRKEVEFIEVPISTELREQAACDDILAILRLISTGQVTVSEKTHYPSAASLKNITSLLSQGDYYQEAEIGEIQSFAWCMLLQAGGLVEGSKLQLTLAGQKALTEPPYKTLRQLWKKWLKTKLLDELRRINNIKGQTGKGQRSLTATEKRRQVFVKALKDCPVGKWVSVGDFFCYIQGADDDFQIARNLEHFKIENSFFSDLGYYESSYGWGIYQGRYLLCLLLEYAGTLGVLDVAYIHPGQVRPCWGNSDSSEKKFFSAYDGLLYFRLNPLGAYCLDITQNYTPALSKTQTKIKVLPNWEIVAVHPLSSREQLQLELYTEKVSDSVWKLTDKILLEANSQGHSLEELEAFLTGLNGEPLPKTVQQLLTDIHHRSQTITRRGMAILIDCHDVALATLIAKDSRTKNYCLLAGESSLVVPVDLETKFRNALQNLGYTLPR